MKTRSLIFLLFAFNCFTVNSQSICDRLETFAASVNRDSLYCAIENKVNERRTELRTIWGIDSLMITEDKKTDSLLEITFGHFTIDKDNTIIMPCIRFFSMQSFKDDSNIYDHICIDNHDSFVLAEVDNKQRLIRLINLPIPDESVFDGISDYTSDVRNQLGSLLSADSFYHMRCNKKMRISMKHILKQGPDLIVFCPILGGDNRRALSEIYDFIYIKDGMMYIYRTSTNKVYELNDYSHTLLNKYGLLHKWELDQ